MISSGTISPGGAGILTIAGNLTQNNGMIEFVIDGPPGSGDDQIQVTGTASISGTLSLVLANGYVPNNDTFTLLTAKLVTGQFALVQVNSPVPLMSNFSTTPGAIGVQLWFVQGNSTTNTNGTVDAATYNQGIPGENLGLGERASLLEGLLGTRSNSIASLLQADSILISGSLAAFARPLDRSLLSGAGGGMMGILGGMRTGGRSGGSDTIEGLALADDLFATLPLILPEVELPSEEQTLTTDDIAGALLVGGAARADILPQRGAQLAPVATLVSGEDDRPRVAVDETDAALAGLMINPLDRALDGPMELHLAEQEEVPRDAWRDAVLGWIALLGVAGCGLRRGELIRRRWIR